MVIKVNTYNLGVRDERARVRKLLQGLLLEAIEASVPDEDTEVDEREEQIIRSCGQADCLQTILLVLDNWRPQ